MRMPSPQANVRCTAPRRRSRSSRRDVGRLAPAAEGEEDEDHRQGDPTTSSRRRDARRGGGEDETGDDDRHQATDLERGERVLQPAALPQAGDVDQREPTTTPAATTAEMFALGSPSPSSVAP